MKHNPLIITATPNICWLKPDVPYPITTPEIIEESNRCREAGAAVLHTHAEKDWSGVINGVRAANDLIIQSGMSSIPLMERIVQEGIAQGVFYTPFPAQISELVLRLCMQMTDEVAFLLAKTQQNADILVVVFEKLKLYRHAIENLLYAPYGSVIIFELSELGEICRAMLERSA
jgi:uncharacterized protein (DUF849 family)